jgi:hypothetical protein
MHGLYRVVQSDEVILISATTTGSMAATLVGEGMPEGAVLTLLDVTDKDRKGIVIHARSRHVSSSAATAGSDDLSPNQTLLERRMNRSDRRCRALSRCARCRCSPLGVSSVA